jgi:hypothetical protein
VEVLGAGRLRARLPVEQPAGLVWLEAERGPLLSAPRPLLLLPPGCQALAAELQALLAGAGAPASTCWQGARRVGARPTLTCNVGRAPSRRVCVLGSGVEHIGRAARYLALFSQRYKQRATATGAVAAAV